MTKFTTKQNTKLQDEANKIYKYRNTKKLFTPEEEDKYLKRVSTTYSKNFGIPSSIITNKINELIGYNVAEDKILEQRNPKFLGGPMMAEGGAMDDQMNALAISVAPAKVEAREVEEPMLPDEEMEEDYVDYVVEETLSTEDKTYLNAALEKDDRLSELFDQVVESATEFTGSGTVEGPGTGRSDSIPARLSDGEFVFTAKATEEIGEDTLMSMMKEAEAAADGRRDMADGGAVEEDETVYKAQPEPQTQDIRVTKETVGSQAMMKEEEDLVGDELKKSMLSTRAYVRS